MKSVLSSFLMLFAAVSLATAEEPVRPNVIVIFTDDHGYADLSAQGVMSDIKTPHIDALAASGARMTSGYVTAPQCVPSRAGLLSGCYQNRFGVESNGLPLDGFDKRETIAERLKRAGYATGMTGKWHLGPSSEIVTHGFDDVYYKSSSRAGWANFELDGRDRKPGVEHSKRYHLDANSEAACAFIKRHQKKPFFFYCAYRAPHVPLDAPPKYLKRFPGQMPERRRQALAMMSAVDDGVGKIVATLRELQLEERTLIFFIGDNGAPLKIHKLDAPGGGPGWDGSLNDPLNGEKGMLSEGGIRVPFVVSWKGRIPDGQVYNHPVISLDVAATAAAVAGLPEDDELDGVNLVPHLSGEKKSPPHKTLYWRWIAQAAVREGKWKYLRGGAREYLFDLDADPEEKHSLLAEQREVALGLKRKLAAWAGELQPPGLETKKMSNTWESYFDHYLDGKPVALPAARTRPEGERTASFKGWIARNAATTVKDGSLNITTSADTKKPFVARSRLRLAGPIVANVRLRVSQSGKVRLSWRENGQREFPPLQVVSVDVKRAAEFQDVMLKAPVKQTAIHVRLHLPAGTTAIRQIDLQGQDGKKVGRNFGEGQPRQ